MRIVIAAALCLGILAPSRKAARAAQEPSPLEQSVSAYELIAAMNVLRMSNGLPALIEDATINAVAQGTAQVMADGLLSWHIGDVKGRLAAAGYGGGKTVFGTENFAIAGEGATIDQIMLMWADYDHMRPATQPNYCHVGAGTAKASNGMTYYILQAAYISGEACAAAPPGGQPLPPGQTPVVPGVVTPVELVEPDGDGNYLHIVKAGQSFWSIAVAYKVTANDIRAWNNLPESYVLQPGDELIIRGPESEGVVTPTPIGAVELAAARPDGSIVHVVRAYQNLSRISTAYGVSVESLVQLNGWSIDWPLQIDQELVIKGPNQTPTPTARPLSPIEMLTPAADGKYYHVVGEGQNPSWIAAYYGITLADLLAWNFLNASSVVYVGDRLLLQVTPPATQTPTSLPATETPQPTRTPSLTLAPTQTAAFLPTETATAEVDAAASGGSGMLYAAAGAAVIGAVVILARNRRKKEERGT